MAESKPSGATKSDELLEQAPEPIADDDQQDITATNAQATETADPSVKPTSGATPPAPATDRPTSREQTSEQQQAESTLIEAFPGIEAKVVKAVLLASGGNLEQAFNALLSMSDPSFSAPNPQPVAPPPQTTAEQRQMEQDEMYARQLAQHYQTAQRPPRVRSEGGPPLPSRPQSDQDRLYPDERERNFFDDDLTEIKEGVKKTFLETQKTFTSWVSKIQKKLEGDDQDPYDGPPALDRPEGSQYARRSDSRGYDRGRRSGDTDAFDADPRVIGDDFEHLELRDDYSVGPEPPAPTLPGRPAANPDIFKPTPPTPNPPQSGPVDEVDAAERKQTTSAPMSGGKSTKWQPLTSLEPREDAEDNDPFSVGDDGDEDSPATTASAADDKTKDLREADSARLKEAARKSSAAEEKPDLKELKEHEKGSIENKDKTAEILLTSETPAIAAGNTASDDKKENEKDDNEHDVQDDMKATKKGPKKGAKKEIK